ncbi:MAG: ROK family protein [Candidatus Micrarchaeota archaeon]|nr:ROK family protein [Candidatus Micrarchaeota archaeon]
MDTYIGIDVGKTKVAAGLVSPKGKVLRRSVHLRKEMKDSQDVLAHCVDAASEMIHHSSSRPKGIGIGTLGIVDPFSGSILYSSVWRGFNISSFFRNKLGIRTFAANDVRAAALGEHLFGASRGCRLSVYLTISSGVAFCTIEDGRIINGSHLIAGQLGPMMVHEDGSRIESRFSGMGIRDMASRGRSASIETKDVFKRGYGSRNRYSKIIEDAVHSAAAAIAIIQSTVDPELIVVGGSVANNQHRFISEAKAKAEKMMGNYMVQFPKGINLVHSKLGADAGIIGAAALAMPRRRT